MATDFQAIFFKGMPTDTPGGYDVEHTPQVYLVDRTGRLRATFYSASVDAMVDCHRRRNAGKMSMCWKQRSPISLAAIAAAISDGAA